MRSNVICGTLFQALDDLGWIGFIGGPEEEMEMLGHQNPSEQTEIPLLAMVSESLDKMRAETVGIKQAGAAVSGGSDEMQVVQSIVMALLRHGDILQPRIAHITNTARSMRHAAKVVSVRHGGKRFTIALNNPFLASFLSR
jgi:hypothetical protein